MDSLILGSVAAIALLLGLALDKRVGFAILIAEIPLMSSAVFKFITTQVVFLVIVILGIFLHIVVKGDVIIINRRFIPLLIFCMYVTIHIVIWLLEDPTIAGLNLLVYYWSLFIFAILLRTLIPLSLQDLANEIARWLAIGLVVYWILIIVLFIIAPENVSLIGEFGIIRLLGLGGTHPAYTASFVPFMFALGLYFMTSTPKNILLGVSLLVIMVVSIIATASRAGLVSVGITLSLLIIYLKHLRLRILFCILICIFIFVFFISRIEEHRIEYFTTIMTTDLSEVKLGSRLFEYQASKDLFLSHPLFGTGLGKFRLLALPLMLYYADRIKPGYSLAVLKSMENAPFSVNSTYLFYLVQTGVIGFGLFAYLVLYATRKLARLRRSNSAPAWDFLFVGWLGFLLHLMVVQGFIHPLLWFIIALSYNLPSYKSARHEWRTHQGASCYSEKA